MFCPLGTNPPEASQRLQAASQPPPSRAAGGAAGSQRPRAPLPQEPTAGPGAPHSGPGVFPPTSAGRSSSQPPDIAAAAVPELPVAGPAAPAHCLAVSFMLSPSPSPSPTEGKRERAWAAAGRLPVSQAAELKRRRAREKEAEQLSRGRGRLLSAASLAALPGGICRDGVGEGGSGVAPQTFPPRGKRLFPAARHLSPPHTHASSGDGAGGRRPPCPASIGRRVRTLGALGAARTCLPEQRRGPSPGGVSGGEYVGRRVPLSSLQDRGTSSG